MDTNPISSTDLIEKTWAEIGYKIHPLRNLVMVRTDPIPDKIGSIYLPPKLQTFYGELPHLQLITATILSAGKDVKGVKVGDRVAFTRLHFARFQNMQDGTKVGWMPEDQLAGLADE